MKNLRPILAAFCFLLLLCGCDDPALRYEGEITNLEVNQGLSYGLDPVTGQAYPMDKFVAGRETAVIARITAPIPEKTAVSMNILCDGEVMTTIAPDEALREEGSVTFFTAGADLEPGYYTFQVNIGAVELSREALFARGQDLNMLVVPVRGNFNGLITEPLEGWQNMTWHLQACFPLSDLGVHVDTAPLLDLSDETYNLLTDEAQYPVWLALADLKNQAEYEEYDLIVGVVSGAMGSFGTTGGYTYGLPAVILNGDLSAAPAVLSHEVAHCYLVGDEYDGGMGVFNLEVNSPPYDYEGKSWYNPGELVRASNPHIHETYDFPNLWCSGSAVIEEQVPMNVKERRLLGNVANIMASCDMNAEEYWISSQVWEQLFLALTVRDYAVETGFKGGVLQNEDGDLELFCENCYHGALLQELEFYGYCSNCWGVTLLDQNSPNVSFTCQSCGAFEEEPVLFYRCAFPYCQEFLRIEPGEEGDEPVTIAFGNQTAGSQALADDPYVKVLRIEGVITKGEGGSSFTPYSLTEDVAHIDEVNITKNDGSCALLIYDSQNFAASSLYFDPEFWVTGEVPISREQIPLRLTMRLPEDAGEIVFYHTVPAKDGEEGYMDFGGWRESLAYLND